MCPKAQTAIALAAFFLSGLLFFCVAYADDAPLEAPGAYRIQAPTGSPPAPPLPNAPPGSRTPPQPAAFAAKNTAETPADPRAPPPRGPTPPPMTPPVPPLSPMPEEAPLPTPVTGAAGTASGGEIAAHCWRRAHLDTPAAVPMTVARFRFQDGFNDNFPNRGDFFLRSQWSASSGKEFDFQEYREYLSTRPCPWRRSSSNPDPHDRTRSTQP